MREARFVDGKLQGDLVEWDQNNRVTRRSSWDDNRELITDIDYYHRNQKRMEQHFLGPRLEFDGQDDWWNARPASFTTTGSRTRHGLVSEWFRNGQVKMRGQFRDDERQGWFVWWHDNGQKKWEGQCKLGKMHGVSTAYSETGVKTQTVQHEDAVNNA